MDKRGQRAEGRGQKEYLLGDSNLTVDKDRQVVDGGEGLKPKSKKGEEKLNPLPSASCLLPSRAKPDKCAVCQVEIQRDTVFFTHGKPGTRDRLWARVCQYTEKPGCINKISNYPGLQPKHID